MWKIVFYFIIVWSMAKGSQDVSRNTDWESSSFFYGILSGAANSGHGNNTCVKEIKVILKGFDEKDLWALKTYDASGTTSSNFVYSQIFWLVSEFSCDNLNKPFQLSISDDYYKELNFATAPFEMKYVIVSANFISTLQYGQQLYLDVPIHIGLCLPKACTSKQIFEFSQRYFSTFKANYNLTLDVIEVKRTSFSDFILHKDAIFIISTIVILGFIIILFDIVLIRHMKANNVFKLFVKCLNLKENYKHLMSTTTRPKAIDS